MILDRERELFIGGYKEGRAAQLVEDAPQLTIAGLATTVRRLERIKTAMRRGYCEFEEESERDYPGVERCTLRLTTGDIKIEDACRVCQNREAAEEHVQSRLANARRRLRAAIDRRL